jgi:hypothetical protein
MKQLSQIPPKACGFCMQAVLDHPPGTLYCSKGCRQKAMNKRRYQRRSADQLYQVRKKAYQDAYRQRPYVRERQKQYSRTDSIYRQAQRDSTGDRIPKAQQKKQVFPVTCALCQKVVFSARRRRYCSDACCAVYHQRKTEEKRRAGLFNTPASQKHRKKPGGVIWAIREFVINVIKTKTGCQDCGIHHLPPECYEFDHRNPLTKVANVSALVPRCVRDLAPVIRELAKCDVVCANCHRIRSIHNRDTILAAKAARTVPLLP